MSKYNLFTPNRLMQRSIDYLFYDMDGKKYISQIVLGLSMGWNFAYDVLTRLEKDGLISRARPGKKGQRKTRK
jgi:surfactin synthase thioesterase subunit